MRTSNPGAVIEDSIRYDLLKDIFRRIGKREVLIDVGCGTRPYMNIYAPHFTKTIGADLQDSPFEKVQVDLFCDAVKIPLSDESVDVHFSSEVLHDIAEPHQMTDEAFRLLRPGGYIVLTTPFMVPVCDGIYDHYRYTRYGLKHLLSKSGFSEIEVHENAGLIGTIIQLSIKPHLRFWNKLSKLLHLKFFRTFWNPFMLVFVLFPQMLYLGLYYAGKKIKGADRMTSYYPNSPLGYVCFAKKPDG